MPTISAADAGWQTEGCELNPAAERLVRGVMVILHGILSKPELNGRHCLVVGPLTATGRAPVAVAPVLPTEPVISLAVKPENCALPPEPPERLGTAWNNLALAYKRAGRYEEAGAAYETGLELAPGKASVLANYTKLCLVSAREQRGDPQALQQRAGELLQELFRPVTSLPEHRGLDSAIGIDFVPGREQRMLHCGIVNSVDAQPARTKYARQFIYDPELEALVEIDPDSGVPISAEAQEAVRGLRGGGPAAWVLGARDEQPRLPATAAPTSSPGNAGAVRNAGSGTAPESAFDAFFDPLVAAGVVSETDLDRLTDVLARGEHGERALVRGWSREKLLRCAQRGQTEAVAALLGARADASEVCPQSGYTPLVMAVQERQEATVEVLLASGADPAQSTTDGCTPLIMLAEPILDGPDAANAAWRDEAGARLARRLISAAGQAESASVSRLLAVRDCNGLTALLAAAYHGNVLLMEALLEAGASCNEPTADGDRTSPLMLCLVGQAAEPDRRPLLELLLAARANVGAKDASGRSAFQFAMGSGRPDLTRLLHDGDDDGDDGDGGDGDDGMPTSFGSDGMPLDGDVGARLLTSLCMQRERENARLGREETDEEIFRAVANSPYYKATLEAKGELREDHEAVTARFWPTEEEARTSR